MSVPWGGRPTTFCIPNSCLSCPFALSINASLNELSKKSVYILDAGLDPISIVTPLIFITLVE